MAMTRAEIIQDISQEEFVDYDYDELLQELESMSLAELTDKYEQLGYTNE